MTRPPLAMASIGSSLGDLEISYEHHKTKVGIESALTASNRLQPDWHGTHISFTVCSFSIFF